MQGQLNLAFRKLLSGVAERLQVEPEQVFALNASMCMYRVKSGLKKGEQCQFLAGSGGYCKKHTVVRTPPIMPKLQSNGGLLGGTVKAQDAMTSLLNTIVPHIQTELTPIVIEGQRVFLNDSTELVFDTDYSVLGQLQKGKITRIGEFLVEKCDEMGWKYTPDIIDRTFA